MCQIINSQEIQLKKALKSCANFECNFFFCFFKASFLVVDVKPKIEGWEGSTLQKIVAKCHKTGALFCYSASGLWGKLQIRVGRPSFLKKLQNPESKRKKKNDVSLTIINCRPRKIVKIFSNSCTKTDLTNLEKPEYIKIPQLKKVPNILGKILVYFIEQTGIRIIEQVTLPGF